MLGEADREEVRLEIVDAKNISERSTFKAGGHLGKPKSWRMGEGDTGRATKLI